MSTDDLPNALAAESWNAAQRLLALQHTHGLSGTALHAWCREKGLFEHQLIAWRDAFCAVAAPESRDAKMALRELQTRHESLQRDLRRKEKALAEAAALAGAPKKVPGPVGGRGEMTLCERRLILLCQQRLNIDTVFEYAATQY